MHLRKNIQKKFTSPQDSTFSWKKTQKKEVDINSAGRGKKIDVLGRTSIFFLPFVKIFDFFSSHR